MSFLQPVLLFGLPLVLVPLIIHLIHILRRKQIRWAAMMFLHRAQRMNKGLSKLRQYLIMAFRMLVVAALIFMVGRPLAGGLLGLTGGAPDSVIILLDRSASMEEQLLSTGTSKRVASLRNLTAAIKEAYGTRSTITVIDSATLEPVRLENPDALEGLPQAGPTDSAGNVPALLQAGLDFITNNKTGRTDLWLVSDLRDSDWNAQGGRWSGLREAYSSLDGVRFQVLAYPESEDSDFSIAVEQVQRRQSAGQAELLLDFRVKRRIPASDPITIPVKVVVNGTSSTFDLEFKGSEVLRQAHSIPISNSIERGWGRVELPADGSPADNAWHFVFDDPPPLQSVIVSDSNEEVVVPLKAALSAPRDPAREYLCTVLPTNRAAEVPWDECALLVWHAVLPEADSVLAKQLESFLATGRRILFLPPANPTNDSFDGIKWTEWQSAQGDPILTDWWRNDSGLLASTRSGKALPVGDISVRNWCPVEGEFLSLAKLGEEASSASLLLQSMQDGDRGAYFLGTLPGLSFSNLSRGGIVFFAMLHRALDEGAAALGNALQRTAGPNSLDDDPAQWKRLDVDPESVLSMDRALRAGVLERKYEDSESPSTLVALNRARDEDSAGTVGNTTLEELFTGLDWRLHERTLEEDSNLTTEVWRTFLVIMAIALVIEALLCLPGKPEQQPTVATGRQEPVS